MRQLLTASVLTAVIVVPAAPGAGQSVAEAARREKERRAKQAKEGPARVYTDADLAAVRPPGEAAAAPAEKAVPEAQGAAPADPAPSPAPAVDDGEAEARERKRLEAEWRIRFADTRRRISEAEARCWTREVQTVFVAGIPVQQWVPVFYESEELRQRKRDLVDLEEEYRKTGLPPGWVRE
jgi:hypothetical protein